MTSKDTRLARTVAVMMVNLIATVIGAGLLQVRAQTSAETTPLSGERDDRVAMLRDAAARVRTAVEAGTLTADEGRAQLAGLRERSNKPDDATARDGERGRGERHAEILETVAALIGIDMRTLQAELEAGKLIAEVAQANGIDPQTIIDALVAEVQADIDAALAASRISSEEAAAWSAEMAGRLAHFVNDTAAVLQNDGGRELAEWLAGIEALSTVVLYLPVAAM